MFLVLVCCSVQWNELIVNEQLKCCEYNHVYGPAWQKRKCLSALETGLLLSTLNVVSLSWCAVSQQSLSNCCQLHSFALNERETVVKESPTLYVYSIRLTSLLLSNVGSMLSTDLSTMCKIPLEAIILPCKSFPFLLPPWILILSWLSWKKTGSE